MAGTGTPAGRRDLHGGHDRARAPHRSSPAARRSPTWPAQDVEHVSASATTHRRDLHATGWRARGQRVVAEDGDDHQIADDRDSRQASSADGLVLLRPGDARSPASATHPPAPSRSTSTAWHRRGPALGASARPSWTCRLGARSDPARTPWSLHLHAAAHLADQPGHDHLHHLTSWGGPGRGRDTAHKCPGRGFPASRPAGRMTDVTAQDGRRVEDVEQELYAVAARGLRRPAGPARRAGTRRR